MSERTLKVHPAALAFPKITGKDLKELEKDIAEHGIRVPILVNKEQDTILDGRNRWMIAHELGLKEDEIPLQVFKGTDEEATAEIVSRNLFRRHLSDDQRVMIAAKLLGKKIEETAASDRAYGSEKSGDRGSAAARLAKAAGTTRHKAEGALSVAKHTPQLAERVIAGKTPLKKARKVAAKKAGKKSKAGRPALTFEQQVERKWLKFMTSFAVSDARAVRKIVKGLLDTPVGDLCRKK